MSEQNDNWLCVHCGTNNGSDSGICPTCGQGKPTPITLTKYGKTITIDVAEIHDDPRVTKPSPRTPQTDPRRTHGG